MVPVCGFSFMVLALVKHWEMLVSVLGILLHFAEYDTTGSNTQLILVTVGMEEEHNMPLGRVAIQPYRCKHS